MVGLDSSISFPNSAWVNPSSSRKTASVEGRADCLLIRGAKPIRIADISRVDLQNSENFVICIYGKHIYISKPESLFIKRGSRPVWPVLSHHLPCSLSWSPQTNIRFWASDGQRSRIESLPIKVRRISACRKAWGVT